MDANHLPAKLPAGDILKTEWPEPNWIIQGILPIGLTFLAGAPKVGKSWMAMSIAMAKASGSEIFGRKVNPGAVLYLALEDRPQRLKARMICQGWPTDLQVDFITPKEFRSSLGDLGNGGRNVLENMIKDGKYHLVVIDTLSRAIKGDQNDVQQMTAWLGPLQELANIQNCAILMLDHHNKMGASMGENAVSNILGSTAKGAVADTIWGLYRELTKGTAKLVVTGRDINDMTLNLQLDKRKGLWTLVDNDGLSSEKQKVLDVLFTLGSATTSRITKEMGPGANRGTVHKHLLALMENCRVTRNDGKLWMVVEDEEEEEES